jgi:hypothetical protein
MIYLRRRSIAELLFKSQTIAYLTTTTTTKKVNREGSKLRNDHMQNVHTDKIHNQ